MFGQSVFSSAPLFSALSADFLCDLSGTTKPEPQRTLRTSAEVAEDVFHSFLL